MKLQPEGTSRRGFLGSVGMAAGLAVVPLAAVPRARATGKLPVFARGVSMEEVTDDGSSEWKDLHSRAQQGGVHVGARPKG
ncbi:MAG: hypothetical protein H0W08_23680 [Acidobacteria bacterium]|nr:hypothetical protein [Acidobacteriota bacterium]